MVAIYNQVPGTRGWTQIIGPQQLGMSTYNARKLAETLIELYPDKNWAIGRAFQDGLWVFDKDRKV